MKIYNVKNSLIAAVAGLMMFASCGEPLDLAYIKDAPRNVEISTRRRTRLLLTAAW